MFEVILDTETTGLSTKENHKIVEIGCIELNNLISTNKIFHVHINPKRAVSGEAYKIHGYSDEFLSNKKTFSEISKDFLNFIKDKKIVIHNAPFDLSFLNYELKLINEKPINKKNVVDTLEIARSKYPGAQNSLDALCKRFNIDNSTREKHKIVEIGCIELENQIPTNNIFHEYLNPGRTVSEEAYKIHGYSEKFLSDKKTFAEIAESFLDFIRGKKLIIHNAPFDLSFLNYEMKLLKKEVIDKKNVIDTLEIARIKYPGSQNSLDALCKRLNIDNSKREKHNALIDCHLLREIYINLVDQKEPKFNLENIEMINSKFHNNINKRSNISKRIIKPSNEELQLHKKYLKSQLSKNYYN